MKNETQDTSPVLLAKVTRFGELILSLNPDNPKAGAIAKGALSGKNPLEVLFGQSKLPELGFDLWEIGDTEQPSVSKDGVCYTFPYYYSGANPLEWLLQDGFVKFQREIEIIDRPKDIRSLVLLDETPVGDLRIRINPENPDAAEEIAALIDKHLYIAFSEILEQSGYIGNDWHVIAAESVSALTSSPIIGFGQYGGDDNGKGCFYEKMWFFPQYVITDPVEVLLRDGVVFFDNAEPVQAEEHERVLCIPHLIEKVYRVRFWAENDAHADAMVQGVLQGGRIPEKWCYPEDISIGGSIVLPVLGGEFGAADGEGFRASAGVLRASWDGEGKKHMANSDVSLQRAYVVVKIKGKMRLLPLGKVEFPYGTEQVGLAICEPSEKRGAEFSEYTRAGDVVVDGLGNAARIVYLFLNPEQ